MNPQKMHACNPIDGQPWAYYMLYIDVAWLTALRSDLGLLENSSWLDISTEQLKDSQLYRTFINLCETLISEESDLLSKQSELILCLSKILPTLSHSSGAVLQATTVKPECIKLAANHIDNNCTDSISLDELSELAKCSSGHLIKAFRKHFGFSPHAYLLNRRIQFAQAALKNGSSIAEAALNAGFSDQAHFQRVFKKHVAATPRQYR